MATNTISQTEAIDLYKTVLSQESFNHNIFITVLLGIVVILLGATWWFNKNGAAKTIKEEVEKSANEERAKINSEIDTKIKEQIKHKVAGYKNQIKGLEMDVYRSLAILARNGGVYTHSIYWFAKVVEMTLEVNPGENTQLAIGWLISEIESLENFENEERTKNPDLSDDYYLTIHEAQDIIKIIEKVPDYLSKEKKRILKFVKLRVEENDD